MLDNVTENPSFIKRIVTVDENNLVNYASKMSRSRKTKVEATPCECYKMCMENGLSFDMLLLAEDPILKATIKICISVSPSQI